MFDPTIAEGAKGCLVDTSIWIEVLRSGDRQINHPVTAIVEELSETDFIYTSRMIVAEIIAGAKDRGEAERLEQDFEGYQICFEDLGLFRDAAYTRQAYMRIHRRSRIPGLIDCYLVNLAKKESLIIFTADRLFRSVAEYQGLKGIFCSIQTKQISYMA